MDYDRDALKLAIRCVVEEGVPIRQTAEMYNVCQSQHWVTKCQVKSVSTQSLGPLCI